MAKLLMFDFECRKCGHQFEDLVKPTRRYLSCPHCNGTAARMVSKPNFDWRKMGVSMDFPTFAAKWDKAQLHKTQNDNGGRADGAPNLKMY